MTLGDIEQKHIQYWLADFVSAMGCQGIHRTLTAVTLSPGEDQTCRKLTLDCFAMLTHPEEEAVRVPLRGGQMPGKN